MPFDFAPLSDLNLQRIARPPGTRHVTPEESCALASECIALRAAVRALVEAAVALAAAKSDLARAQARLTGLGIAAEHGAFAETRKARDEARAQMKACTATHRAAESGLADLNTHITRSAS